MKPLYFAAAAIAALAMSHTAARAEDAEYGCKILLCAASQNPSWHGVPYCVPPMTKLIRDMAEPGFSWPICREANTGKPGHEEYEECPAGMKATRESSGSGRDNAFVDHGREMCVKTVNQCRNRAEFRTLYGNERENAKKGITIREVNNNRDNSWSGANSCEVVVSQPRPRRADPYYFDIPDDKVVKKRVWFNLNP